MAKGHSSGNGKQRRALVRELKAIHLDRDKLNSRIDRVVALADRELSAGVSSKVTAPPAEPMVAAGDSRNVTVPTMPTAVPPLGSDRPADPFGAGLHGISRPVPDLPINVAREHGAMDISAADLAEKVRQGYTLVFGASGSPITGGFLVDLGEYNRQMMGLNAVRTYEKMVRGDGQVRGLLNALEWPIGEARWTIEPPVDKDLRAGQSKSKAKETADFVRENLMGGLEWRTARGGWASQDFKEIVEICLGMLSFGCKVGELVHTVDGSKLRLRRVADREPLTYYRWHTDPSVVDPSLPANVYDDGETLQAVQQYGYRGCRFITPILPVDKIIRITFGQRGANFWGIPPTRVMMPDWFVKSSLKRIDAIGCERTSMGIPVVILPPGASKQDVATAQTFVSQLAAHEKTGLVLPNGAEFKIVGTEGHEKEVIPSMEYADMQMTRSVCAMFMNIGGQRGMGSGRAQSESQTNFFVLGLQKVADHIARVIRNDIVRPLVAMNFGEDAPVPTVIAENVQARGLEQKAEIISKMAQQGAWVSDRGSINQDRHELGYPEFEDEDVVLARGVTIQGLNDPATMAQQLPQPAAPPGKGKLNSQLFSSRPTRVRDQVSPLWKDGDPTHLRKVHAHELHIDFPAHLAAMERAETAARGALARAKPRLVRSAARTFALALKNGANVNTVAPEHDRGLVSELAGILARAHAAGFAEARAEHNRLFKGGKTRFDVEPISDRPGRTLFGPTNRPKPQLRAEIAVQDVIADIAQAARKAALDLYGAGLGDQEGTDAIADQIYGQVTDTAYVDAGMDKAAGEAANEAFRIGRSDAFMQVDQALRAAGVQPRFFRVGVLDKNICGNCESLDGTPCRPDEDLSRVCDGKDLCRCQVAEAGYAVQ